MLSAKFGTCLTASSTLCSLKFDETLDRRSQNAEIVSWRRRGRGQFIEQTAFDAFSDLNGNGAKKFSIFTKCFLLARVLSAISMILHNLGVESSMTTYFISKLEQPLPQKPQWTAVCVHNHFSSWKAFFALAENGATEADLFLCMH